MSIQTTQRRQLSDKENGTVKVVDREGTTFDVRTIMWYV